MRKTTYCFKNCIFSSCLKNIKVEAQTKHLIISIVFKMLDLEEVKEPSHFKASNLSCCQSVGLVTERDGVCSEEIYLILY